MAEFDECKHPRDEQGRFTNEEYSKYIDDMIPDADSASYIKYVGLRKEENKQRILDFMDKNEITSCKNMFEDVDEYNKFEKLLLFASYVSTGKRVSL